MKREDKDVNESTSDRPAKRARKPCVCSSLTHQRTTSLQCKLNKIYVEAAPALQEQLRMDETQQSAMDTIGTSQELIAGILNEEK